MATFTTDPMTQVLDRLWDALGRSPAVADAVRPGNRIKFTGTDPDPAKTALQAGDMPELAIVPGQWTFGPRSSTSRQLVQSFTVQLATGDNRLAGSAARLFPLKWAIVKAIEAAGDNLALPFVQSVRFGGGQDSLTDGDANRGPEGWSTVATVTVDMSIATRDLME